MTALLIDEHPAITDSLGRLLESRGCCAHVASPTDVFSRATTDAVDLALIEMWHSGEMCGPRMARHITQTWTAAKVCFFTVLTEDVYSLAAYRSGYHGWIDKRRTMDQVGRDLDRVLAGERVFSQAVVEQEELQEIHRLSAREHEVLAVVGLGYTRDSEIANVLHISTPTARTHIRNCCTKLGLQGKHDLVRYAVAHRQFL